MKNTFKAGLLALFSLISINCQAAILWVGNSTACTGSNVHSTFGQALLTAALNGQSTDEIRLTNTVSYTGNTHGNHTLTDWNSTGAGMLTIVGGYPDCFTTPNSRTLVGNSSTSSFTINTNNHDNSIITLRNLRLSGNDSRGVVARAGAIVTLDNVDVQSNGYSGVDVGGGAYVEILSNSLVRNNLNFNNPFGGGVRCTGADSSVIIHGELEKNRAQKGGNLFVSTGCYAELKDGMRITGGSNPVGDAVVGGGAYIDDGGILFADGRANRVIFDANVAENGGALFINGTGFALLENTHFNNNEAIDGAAIYAQEGGTSSPQLIMDQTTDCDLLFRCSEIQGSRYEESVVFVYNAMIQIQRTVIEQSVYTSASNVATGLITSIGGSRVRLNRVGMIRNSGNAMLRSDNSNDLFEVSHFTMAENHKPNSSTGSHFAVILAGTFNIQNSLITDSSGIDNRSGAAAVINGDCNLIDNDTEWPASLYHLGTAQLVNPAAGDGRQIASSPGVDMCLQDSFSWSSEIDIENQTAPVNENTNPQGLPGDVGGLYDAGFDEVYDHIGNDEFLLSIQKEGSGEGVVVSNPSGISCGNDCSQVYFKGTIVTLNAAALSGSEFEGWLNCPLVNQAGQCLTNIQTSHTIRAVFQPNDLIFSDGFQ